MLRLAKCTSEIRLSQRFQVFVSPRVMRPASLEAPAEESYIICIIPRPSSKYSTSSETRGALSRLEIRGGDLEVHTIFIGKNFGSRPALAAANLHGFVATIAALEHEIDAVFLRGAAQDERGRLNIFEHIARHVSVSLDFRRKSAAGRETDRGT